MRITFQPLGKTVKVDKNTTLLEAAAQAGVYTSSVCRGDGICGKCRLIVKEGKVYTNPTTLLTREEIQRGYILACQTKADGHTVVEVPPESRVEEEKSQEHEFVALAVIEGRIKLVSLSSDGKYKFLDSFNNLHNILWVWSLETKVFQTAVEELEEMVNDPNVVEQDFHEFFERNPQFILTDEYEAAHPKIVLTTDSGERMIPDFVLEPLDQSSLCDLLELKKPSASVFVLKKSRMRFSAAVMEACAQLREYSAYFDEERHRKAIQEKYGLLLYKPRMFVILGRKGKVSPIEIRRVEEDLPRLALRTYDDLILRAKAKIDRIKRGGFRVGR